LSVALDFRSVSGSGRLTRSGSRLASVRNTLCDPLAITSNISFAVASLGKPSWRNRKWVPPSPSGEIVQVTLVSM
jgi:hypothetical protein